MTDKQAGKVETAGGGSTAAVLWLMITLVFLPIVAVHIVARFVPPAQAETARSDPP